jgi:hypothetical protein
LFNYAIGVDHRVGLHSGGQIVYNAEVTMRVADEQESHRAILGSLKIANSFF